MLAVHPGSPSPETPRNPRGFGALIAEGGFGAHNSRLGQRPMWQLYEIVPSEVP